MQKPAVYLETSVVSYATSRPSRDVVTAARQAITREWFESRAELFELFISQVVIHESRAGDSTYSKARLAFVKPFKVLEVSTESGALAQTLVERGAVPKVASEDALHIAIAAVHGMDYLLTWNCKHIANARSRHAIETLCRDAGSEPPVICTPEELFDVPSN